MTAKVTQSWFSDEDIPPAIGIPTKSYNYRTVSSPPLLSNSEQDDEYDTVNLNNITRNVDPIEPPHPHEFMRKNKALTKQEIQSTVTLQGAAEIQLRPLEGM